MPRFLKEEIARKAREKARMIMEGPDAERVRRRFADGNWPAFPNFEEAVGVASMPGHYSEKARRSIFFARYEASQLGSPGAPGLAVFETWVSAAIQQVHFITDFRERP